MYLYKTFGIKFLPSLQLRSNLWTLGKGTMVLGWQWEQTK